MPGTDPVRADLWIWAARFAKTRSLAAEAIKAGRVQVNGAVAKPSREVRPGDRVAIRRGGDRIEVDVHGTARRRGPATEAALLYVETEESLARRAEREAAHRVERSRHDDGGGRPTKRDRRELERLRARERRRGRA